MHNSKKETKKKETNKQKRKKKDRNKQTKTNNKVRKIDKKKERTKENKKAKKYLEQLILLYFDDKKTSVQVSQPVIGPFGSSGGCHVSLTVVGSDCSMSAVNSAGLEDGAAIFLFFLFHKITLDTKSEKQFLITIVMSHKSHIT